MVDEIGREFKKKQAQLGPLMGELKRVRQDYMDIESEYAERKGTYDKVAVGLELEKQVPPCFNIPPPFIIPPCFNIPPPFYILPPFNVPPPFYVPHPSIYPLPSIYPHPSSFNKTSHTLLIYYFTHHLDQLPLTHPLDLPLTHPLDLPLTHPLDPLPYQALERECDQYQDECLREESRFHQLTNLATIARIKLERAGQ